MTENEVSFKICPLFNVTELQLQQWKEVCREKEPYLMGIEMQFHTHSWNSSSNNITLH